MSKAAIEHHLDELRIALDPSHPSRVLPELEPSDRTILDLGCGIGQTLVALDCADRNCIGVDRDHEAIDYAKRKFGDRARFLVGEATRLPLPSGTFDLVYCRVSLPYTNIPRAVGEIRRVLKLGGRVWMTLHSRDHVERCIRATQGRTGLKQLFYHQYVILNGYCLKYFQRLIPFTKGRYESWQDNRAMERLLRRKGFAVSSRLVGNHMIIEGTRNR